MTFNFTIDDTSPVFDYKPFGDGLGWRLYFTESGFNSKPGNSSAAAGASYHIADSNTTSASLSFRGSGINLYGVTNCTYDVILDGSRHPGEPDNEVLFANNNLTMGDHTITLQPHAVSGGLLGFGRAVVTMNERNMTSRSFDNSDVSITYSGDGWEVSSAPTVSSSDHPPPFHRTGKPGDYALFAFNNADMVVVSGPTSLDHGLYEVMLDGQNTTLNGSSSWFIKDTPLFLKNGLDPSLNHSLKITNTGSPGMSLAINSFTTYKVNATSQDNSGSGGRSVHPALIVIPIFAVVALAYGLFKFIVSRRTRRVYGSSDPAVKATQPHRPMDMSSRAEKPDAASTNDRGHRNSGHSNVSHQDLQSMTSTGSQETSNALTKPTSHDLP